VSALTRDPDQPDVWLIPSGWDGHQITIAPLVIRGVHLDAECMGRTCLMHNPSPHHMTSWPLVWDMQRKVFLRVCRHGVAHPDPDSWGDKSHPAGDDGCCAEGRRL
jgi:hypothetical protein